ncbi:hypothetical protein BGZ54_000414, partial [Gamsiella multidivaricata]
LTRAQAARRPQPPKPDASVTSKISITTPLKSRNYNTTESSKVKDLFEDGMVKLMEKGYLESFIERNTRLWQETESDGSARPMSMDDEMNSEMDGIDDYAQITAE